MTDFEEEGKRKDARKERELELLYISHVMKTVDGRKFMWRCLQNCCTFENIYSSDTLQTAYKSGMRSHGLWLDEELRQAAPESYYMMLKENR